MLKTILTISMEVMGMNSLPRWVSIRISPGSFPNQFSNQGARYKTIPIASRIAPAIIIHRAMGSIFLNKLCRTYQSDRWPMPHPYTDTLSDSDKAYNPQRILITGRIERTKEYLYTLLYGFLPIINELRWQWTAVISVHNRSDRRIPVQSDRADVCIVTW